MKTHSFIRTFLWLMVLALVVSLSLITPPIQKANGAYTASDISYIQTTKVTLSSVNLLALNGTPIALVASPGAGKAIQVLNVSTRVNFNTLAYVVAGVIEIKNPSGTNLILPSTSLLIATSTKTYSSTPVAGEMVANEALNISATVANPTTGDGTVDVYVTYRIITL